MADHLNDRRKRESKLGESNPQNTSGVLGLSARQTHSWIEVDDEKRNPRQKRRNWFEKCWRSTLGLSYWDLTLFFLGVICLFVSLRIDEYVFDDNAIHTNSNYYPLLLYTLTVVLIALIRVGIIIFRNVLLFAIKMLDATNRSPASLIIHSVDPTMFYVVHFILIAIFYNTHLLTGYYKSVSLDTPLWTNDTKSVHYLSIAISTSLLWTIIWFLGDLAILYFGVVAFRSKASSLIELLSKIDLVRRIGHNDIHLLSYLNKSKGFIDEDDSFELSEKNLTASQPYKKNFVRSDKIEETYVSPSNIHFWELYRCVNLVRHSPFIIYVNGEQTIITKHYQLHSAAESIFNDLCEHCEVTGTESTLNEVQLRKVFTFDDLKLFMSIVDVSKTGVLTRQKFLHGYHGIFTQKKAMEKSISQHEGVADVVAHMVRTVFFIVFAIGFLVIIGVNPSDFLLSAATVLASLAFVFGNSLKNFVDSLVFIFAQSPFSIGDRIKLLTFRSEQTLIVKKINTMFTSFDTVTNERVYIPNYYLVTQIIINHHRSPPACFYIPFLLASSTCSNVTTAFIQAIQSFMKERASEWVANETCIFWEDFQPGHFIKVSVWAQHTSPWYLWKVVYPSKAELISFCLRWLTSYGVSYCLPEQPVALREFDPLLQGAETFEQASNNFIPNIGNNKQKYQPNANAARDSFGDDGIIKKEKKSEKHGTRKEQYYSELEEENDDNAINKYYETNLPPALSAQLRKRTPGTTVQNSSHVTTLISQAAGVYTPFNFPPPSSSQAMAGLK